MFNRKWSFFCISLVVMLSGCSEVQQKQKIDNQVNKAVDKINMNFDKTLKTGDKYNTHNGFYIEKVIRTPWWLQSHVDINGVFSIGDILNQILAGTEVAAQFHGGANKNKTIKFSFSGSTSEALSYLSKKSGYQILPKNNSVVISDVTTESFSISSIPGDSDFAIGKSDDQSIGKISSSLDDSGGDGSSDQYSKEAGTVSPWKDLSVAIKTLLSSQGTLAISESSSQITVTDHYVNVKKVAEYLKSYNKVLSQQVSYKVQLITVSMDGSHQRGINWNEIFKGTTFKQDGILSGINLSNLNDQAASSNTAAFTISGGKANSLVLTFLSKQGKVLEKNEPIMTTLNNRMAELNETTSIAYVQQITSNMMSGGSSTSDSSSMTPGSITVGMQAFIIPHIQNNRVYTKISLSIASLDAMPMATDNKSGNKMQLPVVSTKKFNQDAILSNGETLVLGGFKFNRDAYNAMKNFGSDALGAFAKAHDNQQLVLLITPYITQHQG
ncbi:hypothetical protein M9194_04285 [Vibrio sp. S4M6]|uniref:hypothetical protein n=1 Tax=Vibrio sinus TaxID=2946865 RepID=UPI00202A63B0|nr:hypothetical protein [Vibrio sinus]MCL9780654.1 hypothetical protein [Vibrio sinus]